MEEWQRAGSFNVFTPPRVASVPLQLNEVFCMTVSSAPLKNRSEASRVPRQMLTNFFQKGLETSLFRNEAAYEGHLFSSSLSQLQLLLASHW